MQYAYFYEDISFRNAFFCLVAGVFMFGINYACKLAIYEVYKSFVFILFGFLLVCSLGR